MQLCLLGLGTSYMSYRKIFSIAWPVALSNITVPLLGSVDIAMMGHFGSRTLLASVAIGAMLFDFLFWGFGFLRMSTTGLIAQAPENTLILKRGLLLALVLSTLLILLQQLIFSTALMCLDTSHRINIALGEYFYSRIYSAVPTLFNYVILGYLFGKQNTKAALCLVVLTNTTAIALDVLMVYVWQLGISGLGIANVLAQSIGCVLGLLYLQHHYRVFSTKEHSALFEAQPFKRMLSLNRDIFIRTFCLLITFAVFTREGAKLGAVIVSANAILLNFQQFMAYALDGFTIASESFVGRAFATRNKKRLISTIKQCSVFCVSGALMFSLFFLLFGDFIIGLMTSLPAVKTQAHKLLGWIILLPIISIGSFILDGVFIGATWSKEMRNSMLLSSIIFLISCYAFGGLKAHGLWLAFNLFMLFRFVLLAERLRGKLRLFQLT